MKDTQQLLGDGNIILLGKSGKIITTDNPPKKVK